MPPAQTSQIQAQKNLRKWLLLGSLLIILLVVFQWFFSRASIEVVVESASNSEITYRFKNQANDKVTEVKDSSKHIKKQLPRGDYELTIQQDKSSYFVVAETGGPRSTTTVRAKPEAEKGRRFIGNQPQSCMFAREGILLSYSCGDAFSSLQTHLPATEEIPTLTQPTFVTGEDVLEGLVHTKSGQDILLIREAESEGHEDFYGGVHSPHTAFVLSGNPATSNMELIDRTPLKDLEGQYTYELAAYQDGFIAYNQELTQLLYYESLSSRPKKLPVEDLSGEQLKPQALFAYGKTYVITYSKEDSDQTTVVVYENERSKRYEFDKVFASAQLCGDKNFCGVGDGWLEVYNLGDEQPELLYRISDALAVENLGVGDQLLVVRKQGVLDWNIKERSGSQQYSFGNYKFCGLLPSEASYSVCIVKSNGTRSVLTIDQKTASDEIDKKIAALDKTPEIKTVSIYDNRIFISPNVGEIKYIESIGGFYYDLDTIRIANTKIKEKIQEIGIDQNTYSIKNSIE